MFAPKRCGSGAGECASTQEKQRLIWGNNNQPGARRATIRTSASVGARLLCMYVVTETQKCLGARDGHRLGLASLAPKIAAPGQPLHHFSGDIADCIRREFMCAAALVSETVLVCVTEALTFHQSICRNSRLCSVYTREPGDLEE
jgi:hypothetical protein